ncbi:MAG: aldo/keto reductase [Nitrospinae bacterium CG11_big_fil_rev_8_21_14_0_20_56_8]|nr:MAG: aldo/keto reductase [Nitrospinae bacterium CG11_big_fil_rev_8_21_14_0_20_56_8]
MEYRRFGKTEAMISVITLGGMRYAQGWNPPRHHLPKASIANCIGVTRRAFDAGINHIETAFGYMKSEHLYGVALKELGVPRNRYRMMTKGNPKNRDETLRLVEAQLKALRLDYLDFYGWHGINNRELLETAVKRGGPVETLYRLREQGVIRHIGFSTHGPLDVILSAIDTDLFHFVNLHYYFFFQKNLPAVERAGQKDMGVFIISPNEKGGLLWKPSEKVRRLSHPLTAMQYNGRFCLSHPQITTLSMGFHEPEHFAPALAILNGGNYFSPQDRQVDERMRAPLQTIPGFCTYCNDCLPCPEDINIPEILRFRNLLLGYDMKDYGRFRYNMLEGKGHWFPGHFASACTQCGDCLPKCPEKLDIPRLLMETHRTLFDRRAYIQRKIRSTGAKILKTVKDCFSSDKR